MSVYQVMYNYIEKAVDVTLPKGIEKVSTYVETPLTTAFILYIVIYGIMLVRGQIQEPLSDFFKRIFKLSIIWYVIINPTVFQKNFGDVFLKYLPQEVGTTLLANSREEDAKKDPKQRPPSGVLDLFVARGYQTGELIIEKSGWLEVGTYILAAIIYLGTVIAGCAAFIIMAMAAIVLSTLLIIGPIFVCLLLFEATSRWFWSWLSNLFSFALMQILLFALLTVASGIIREIYQEIIGKVLDSPEAQIKEFMGYNPIDTAAAFSILTVYIVSLFIFWKLPDISSSISGGASVSFKDLAGQIKNAGSMARTAYSKTVGKLADNHLKRVSKSRNNTGESSKTTSTQNNNSQSSTSKSTSGDSRLMSGKGNKIYADSSGSGSSTSSSATKENAGSSLNLGYSFTGASTANIGSDSRTTSGSNRRQRSEDRRTSKQNNQPNQASMPRSSTASNPSITSNSGSEPSSTSSPEPSSTTAPSSPPPTSSPSTDSQGGP